MGGDGGRGETHPLHVKPQRVLGFLKIGGKGRERMKGLRHERQTDMGGKKLKT